MEKKITSRTNNRIKELALIAKSPTQSSFLVEGYHLVEMAFESSCLKEVYYVGEKPPFEVPTIEVTDEIIDKLARTPSPQGIIGLVEMKKIDRLDSNRAIILEAVQDPGNVGTLIRTALAFGYDDIYLLPGSANPYSQKVITSSQGAIFKANIHMEKDTAGLIKRLKEDGYSIVGTSLHNAINLANMERNLRKIAIIFGNEGSGVKEETLAMCDKRIIIPMKGMESLNVAVAGGILMYALAD